MERETQEKRVLAQFLMCGTVTSSDAFTWYGIRSLAAIVFRLREAGYDIMTVDTEGVNRYGEKCRFATYVKVGWERKDD